MTEPKGPWYSLWRPLLNLHTKHLCQSRHYSQNGGTGEPTYIVSVTERWFLFKSLLITELFSRLIAGKLFTNISLGCVHNISSYFIFCFVLSSQFIWITKERLWKKAQVLGKDLILFLAHQPNLCKHNCPETSHVAFAYLFIC